MKWIGWAILISSLVVVSGCDDIVGFSRVQQDFHYSYAMQPGGHLDIENRNGSIAVLGWDRNSIDIAGTKYAPDHSALQEVKIKIDVNGNTALITTETPSGRWGNFGANYTIHLPNNTVVSHAKSTNGSVTAEDMTSGGSLTSTNGRIALHRDTGNFDLRTTNGGIDFEDCSGVERVETTNGGINGSLKAGSFEARSTNGGIDISLAQPQRDQQIKAITTNGGIHVTLRQFAANPVRLETTHGSITLRLPRDTDAQIDAHTSLAHISSELPLNTEESDRHALRAQLGKGGPIISATTTTGSIRFEDGGR
jgi:DUF4097 and DUF4098 domain-containing protein YvlB